MLKKDVDNVWNGFRRNPVQPKWEIPDKMMDLSLAAADDISLVDKAWDVMCRLRDVTTESVLLEIRVEDEGVLLETAVSPHPLRFTVDPGARFELHIAAGGKVLLAYLPEDAQMDILKQMKFTHFNERTITDRDQFLKELQLTRERGYGVDLGECVEGIHCVSAPIMNSKDEVVASLTVSGPSLRITRDKFETIANQTKEHAEEITRKL